MCRRGREKAGSEHFSRTEVTKFGFEGRFVFVGLRSLGHYAQALIRERGLVQGACGGCSQSAELFPTVLTRMLRTCLQKKFCKKTEKGSTMWPTNQRRHCQPFGYVLCAANRNPPSLRDASRPKAVILKPHSHFFLIPDGDDSRPRSVHTISSPEILSMSSIVLEMETAWCRDKSWMLIPVADLVRVLRLVGVKEFTCAFQGLTASSVTVGRINKPGDICPSLSSAKIIPVV